MTTAVGKFLSTKTEESSLRATTESRSSKSKVPVLKVSLVVFLTVSDLYFKEAKKEEKIRQIAADAVARSSGAASSFEGDCRGRASRRGPSLMVE